ncbi:NAD(P)-binding protein [Mytilinidion resinicola]|uniref:NAD(P)-binding protein n=1 Tax=Mytilinidion resinicola TaxID=574789 RepID=A0A6A6YR08_9PEZI|nr:NAD(P)-binding protein [Mytilinidion resinicola]KAF2811346.1 NAD(P)-binding protein [Mytilinidion resinicola]
MAIGVRLVNSTSIVYQLRSAGGGAKDGPTQVLITGCSSGIGRAIAELVASKPNRRLIATARNPSSLAYLPDSNSNILKLALDVASPTSVDNAFKAAAAHFGASFHIDVLVNNAGYLLSGDTEAATEQEMHDELETNFFGTAYVIYNISSVAGVCGFPGYAFYHAEKFAVEGWTESVAREMHPDWNINFCLVEPGAIKTNFETSSRKHIKSHEADAGKDMPARKLEVFVEQNLKAGVGVEPIIVAQVLFNVANRGEKVPFHLPLTSTRVQLIKMKLEGQLQGLETTKELSDIDKNPA